jgi:fluoride exporter
VTVLAVVVAGAVGAASRFIVDHVVSQVVARVLPVGTVVVNVTGSAAAGLLAGWVARHGLDESVRQAVGSGFLAAFTTFSTFAVETIRLAESDDRGTAVLYVAVTVTLSTAAAALGYALMTVR